jgi:hypothetical protein
MLNALLIGNIALLITHQIDAAYWHEWELFGLPGGIQLYNLINFALFVAILSGIEPILSRKPSGYRNSLVLAGVGASILPIHAAFAIAGLSQFHLPVSIGIIIASFISAVSMATVTMRSRSNFK